MQYFGFDRPSFAFKAFGFGESSPKLQADFTMGTYNSSGAAKTFADLFTFTRAGKAWLVKDTGLQEYAADVPRFDNGLLIEQSATNVWKHSILQNGATNFNPKGGGYIVGVSDLHEGQAITMIRGSYLYQQYKGTESVDGVGCVSYVLSKLDGSDVSVGAGASFNIAFAGAALTNPTTHKITDTHYRAFAPYAKDSGGGLSRSGNAVGEDVLLHSAQFELGERPSSLIVTTTAPVTRPADYLLNNITGTTVTGDWDDTLSLSIVDGQLVHSGYGRIRSLEIN